MHNPSYLQIENRIKSIIEDVTGYEAHLLKTETRLTPSEHADNVLHVGSLELAELLIAIDEAFEVNIPDETAIHLNTIGELTDYVLKHSTIT